LGKKLRVGVIFGGRSGEHEVSLRSAESIINAIDKTRYEVVPIGITQEGRWLVAGEAKALLPAAVMSARLQEDVAIIGDPTKRGLVRLNGAEPGPALEPLDVVFPVLHGTYGEDGTIQGLLEMAGVPYVGCGVLASASAMDKIVMKQLLAYAGLRVCEYEWLLRSAWEADSRAVGERIIARLGYPVFVKPANLGSSVGISKATNESEFSDAVADAARYDRRIIVEKAVMGREVEVSVIGNEEPVASVPGEVIAGREFYDYQDKYVDDRARIIIPADLPGPVVEQLKRDAVTAFKAIDGSGLARVDFFVEEGTDAVITNEINTMPGFTSISMFPKLWEASGVSYSELIDRLIMLAVERHRDRARNLTSYQPR
jgi:D-alanine-D-alanine ligase